MGEDVIFNEPQVVSDIPQQDVVIPELPQDGNLIQEPVGELGEQGLTVGSYFGTLQESVTISWRFHLKTRKHHVHVILNDFYNGAIHYVDKIIEEYQGLCGIIEEPFVNEIVTEGMSEIEYLNALKSYTESGKHILGSHSEIDSSIDEFLGLIDSTLYKLTSFNEHIIKSYDEFCYENLNECGCKNCDYKDYYHDDETFTPDDFEHDEAEEEE